MGVSKNRGCFPQNGWFINNGKPLLKSMGCFGGKTHPLFSETSIYSPRHRLHTFFLRDMTSVRFIQGQVRQGGTTLFSLDRWVQPTGGSLPFKKTRVETKMAGWLVKKIQICCWKTCKYQKLSWFM